MLSVSSSDDGKMETFITDEGLQPDLASILQAVFLSCDENDEGIVKVSKFLQYLNEKAISCEVFEFLDLLRKILDADGDDPAISWAQCESGMQKWIRYINNKNMEKNFVLNVRKSSTSTSTPFAVKKPSNRKMKYDSLSPSVKKSQKMRDKNRSNNVSTYSNDSMDISDLSWDCSDVQSRMEDLEITNRHLISENTKLREQLNVTEDVNTSMLSENEELQKQIIKFQKLVDSNKVDLKHYSDIKTSNLEQLNIIRELQDRNLSYKREIHTLETLNESCNAKISQVEANIELILVEKNKLNDEIIKRVNESEYLNKMIMELSLTNEALRTQKSAAERELSDIKQEVFHGYSALDNTIEEISSIPLLSSTVSNEDSKSLCQELKAEMCMCNSKDNAWINNQETKRNYSLIVHKFELKFKGIKESLVHQLEHLENNTQLPGMHEKILLIFNDLGSDIELYMKQFSSLIYDYQNTERRTSELTDTLNSCKREMEQMNESREKALKKLDNLSNEVSRDKLLLNQTIDENVKLKEVHNTEIVDLHERLSQMDEEVCDEHLQQINDLKVLVEDLECRNLDISKKLFDMEELMTTKEDEISKEKEVLVEKEDAMKLKHEIELASILQTIPCVDPCSPHNSITVDIVVHSLSKFFEKCQCENRFNKEIRCSSDEMCHSNEILNIDNHADLTQSLPQNSEICGDEKSISSECVLDEKQNGSHLIFENNLRLRRCGVSAEPVSSLDISNDKLSPLDYNENAILEEVIPLSVDNISEEKPDKDFVDSSVINNDVCRENEQLNTVDFSMQQPDLNNDESTGVPKCELVANIYLTKSHLNANSEYLASIVDPQLVEKYRRYVISFNADQYTLPRRLKNQQRSRDLAESSFETELAKLDGIIQKIEISQDTSPNFQELFSSFREQLEVLQKVEKKVSQQSEQQGCYQQEHRTGPNIQLVISYVDQLRTYISKMEEELDIAREHLNNKSLDEPICDILSQSSASISDTMEETNEKFTPSLLHVADTLISKRIRSDSFSSNEKEVKSVSFCETIAKEEIYSPTDPIRKSSNVSNFFSPFKYINKNFLWIILCTLLLFAWLAFEIDFDAILEYLPSERVFPNIHENVRGE